MAACTNYSTYLADAVGMVAHSDKFLLTGPPDCENLTFYPEVHRAICTFWMLNFGCFICVSLHKLMSLRRKRADHCAGNGYSGQWPSDLRWNLSHALEVCIIILGMLIAFPFFLLCIWSPLEFNINSRGFQGVGFWVLLTVLILTFSFFCQSARSTQRAGCTGPARPQSEYRRDAAIV